MKLSVSDDMVSVNESIYINFSYTSEQTNRKKSHQVLLSTSIYSIPIKYCNILTPY